MSPRRRAVLYKGVENSSCGSSEVEVRMLDREGESLCNGIGQSEGSVGIIRTSTFSFDQSFFGPFGARLNRVWMSAGIAYLVSDAA